MVQTTSVNSNDSLILRRTTGLPVGAFTITLQGHFATWGSNANQNLIYVEAPGGQGQVYGHVDGTQIRAWDGGSEHVITVAPDAWGMFFIRYAGAGQPMRYGVVYGGTIYEVSGPDLGNISDLQVIGLTIAGSNQSNSLNACSWGVFAGAHTDLELLAQALADTPQKTANSWCPMVSAATVGTATSGASPTVFGTGADAADTPYVQPITGAADLVQAGDTLAAAGSVSVDGAAFLVQEGDTVSATGAALTHTGSLDVQLEGDTLGAAGSVRVTGSLGVQLEGDFVPPPFVLPPLSRRVVVPFDVRSLLVPQETRLVRAR